MAAKNKFMNAMKMPAIADMFSSEADRQRESGDLVTEVPLSELHPFVNHPFEVRDDEDMQKLVDSIKENGVLTNLTVRPVPRVAMKSSLDTGAFMQRSLQGWTKSRCRCVMLMTTKPSSTWSMPIFSGTYQSDGKGASAENEK